MPYSDVVYVIALLRLGQMYKGVVAGTCGKTVFTYLLEKNTKAFCRQFCIHSVFSTEGEVCLHGLLTVCGGVSLHLVSRSVYL